MLLHNRSFVKRHFVKQVLREIFQMYLPQKKTGNMVLPQSGQGNISIILDSIFLICMWVREYILYLVGKYSAKMRDFDNYQGLHWPKVSILLATIVWNPEFTTVKPIQKLLLKLKRLQDNVCIILFPKEKSLCYV